MEPFHILTLSPTLTFTFTFTLTLTLTLALALALTLTKANPKRIAPGASSGPEEEPAGA